MSNNMRSNGEDMPEKKIVEIFNVPWKNLLIVSIEESKDTDNMSIDELQNSLVVHEQFFWISSIDGEEKVLEVEGQT